MSKSDNARQDRRSKLNRAISKVEIQSIVASGNHHIQPSNDPAIALIDAWTIVADMLSFYQEKVASEGYVRTARDRASITETYKNRMILRPVPNQSDQADQHFTVRVECDGTTRVIFSDGITGRLPPSGHSLAPRYRQGIGRSGDVGLHKNANSSNKSDIAVQLVYLDIWSRHVATIDDASLREVASGGPDVCMRTIFRTKLYRIEIHDSGGVGEATFKWSRDNGSIDSPITAITERGDTIRVNISKNATQGFKRGQWVEISDSRRIAKGIPGTLIKLTDVGDDVVVFEKSSVKGELVSEKNSPHRFAPRIRRWDCPRGLEKVRSNARKNGYLELEPGVEVKFGGGTYRTGDYWLVPTRTLESFSQDCGERSDLDGRVSPLTSTEDYAT